MSRDHNTVLQSEQQMETLSQKKKKTFNFELTQDKITLNTSNKTILKFFWSGTVAHTYNPSTLGG